MKTIYYSRRDTVRRVITNVFYREPLSETMYICSSAFMSIVMKEMFILKHVDTRLHFFPEMRIRIRSRHLYGLEPEVHDTINIAMNERFILKHVDALLNSTS